MTTRRMLPVVTLCAGVLVSRATAQRPGRPTPSRVTKIVMLGTGNPSPAPDRMGTSVAIVVNGSPYLFDAGVGVVRRASAANRAGVKGLEMPNLRRVFLTHLHSDHTIGLPDLISTPWIMGRAAPLEVYGPEGTAAMIEHLLQAWSADNDIRIHGLEHGNATGNKAIAHEVKPGVVYRDDNVTVTAFPVKHGSWKEAFGYRVVTPDRTIVLSGDEAPSDEIVRLCDGCDVLMHEVYSTYGYAASPESWRTYLRSFHTSTKELAELARRARPRTLVLYHQMYFGGPTDTDGRLLREIAIGWHGRVIASRDLDVY